MTDNDIIEFFKDKNGKINPNKTRLSYLEKYPEIKSYIEQRYEVFFTYKFALQCIFNHLEELPRCEYCNKPLNHFGRWCNQKCQMNDPKFKVYRESVIDYDKKTQKFKDTCMKKFGTTSPLGSEQINKQITNTCNERYGGRGFRSPIIKEKVKQTIEETYGISNLMYSEQIKDKIKATCMNKFGVENVFASDYGKERRKETCIKKYGAEYTLQSPQLVEKVKTTMKERYDNENFINVEKIKQTKKEKYGDENYNNTIKHAETCNIRYGVDSYSQTEEFMHKRKHKYIIDGLYFDSKPEIAFYIYHRDKHSNITREPKALFYIFEDSQHIYYPDFSINGVLYEIKGNHFFENGKMINPFDRNQDDLYEAKHQCMLENNVTIITDCTPYIDYVKTIYGKTYLNQCKMGEF